MEPRQQETGQPIASVGSDPSLTAAVPVVQDPGGPVSPPIDPVVSWQASEFVHREKDTSWFVWLFGAGAVLLGVSVLLRAWTFTVLVVVMVAALFVLARRPPREVSYSLLPRGLRIGDKEYVYSDFKSFGIVQEGSLYSVQLTPVKRFMPSVSIYFLPQDGERIVDVLGAVIPMRQVKPDMIDKLATRLRF